VYVLQRLLVLYLRRRKDVIRYREERQEYPVKHLVELIALQLSYLFQYTRTLGLPYYLHAYKLVSDPRYHIHSPALLTGLYVLQHLILEEYLYLIETRTVHRIDIIPDKGRVHARYVKLGFLLLRT